MTQRRTPDPVSGYEPPSKDVAVNVNYGGGYFYWGRMNGGNYTGTGFFAANYGDAVGYYEPSGQQTNVSTSEAVTRSAATVTNQFDVNGVPGARGQFVEVDINAPSTTTQFTVTLAVEGITNSLFTDVPYAVGLRDEQYLGTQSGVSVSLPLTLTPDTNFRTGIGPSNFQPVPKWDRKNNAKHNVLPTYSPTSLYFRGGWTNLDTDLSFPTDEFGLLSVSLAGSYVFARDITPMFTT